MFGWSKKLKKGLKTVDKELQYDWRIKERWEDYPFPDYKATHTYCQVSFEGSDRTFYYRTRNPELKVGDLVYVPVGRQYEKKIGRIVTMEECTGKSIPFPLERTKYIYGKVE